MKKTVKLTENDLMNLVKKVLNEKKTDRYMFFSNLQQMQRQCEMLLEMDPNMIESILDNGHDWAQDHIAEAKNNMDQVFDFLMNETKKDDMEMVDTMDIDMIEEAKKKKKNRKKTGTPLCARGIAAAKSKFEVYPSAYANGYAVQVCKGTMPGNDGKKKCSGAYC